jgi:hypothetical protein
VNYCSRYRVNGGKLLLKTLKPTDTAPSQSWVATTGTKTIDFGYSIPANLLKIGDIVEIEHTLIAASGTAVNLYQYDRAGGVIIGKNGNNTLISATDFSAATSARITQASSFMVTSNTTVSGMRVNAGGFGAFAPYYADITRNGTVANITTNAMVIDMLAQIAATSTTTVALENLMITLNTCG